MTVFNPQYDAQIMVEAPTTNAGRASFMDFGWTSTKTPVHDNVIMEFDISSLIGKTLTDAKLEVYLNTGGDGSTTHHCRRLLRFTGAATQWTETGCTWNKYDGTTDWYAAGALGALDYDNAAEKDAAFTVPNSSGAYAILIPTTNTQFLALLQYVLDSQSPAGIAALVLHAGVMTPCRFQSHDVGDGSSGGNANPPKLTITYPGAARRIFVG